MPCSLNWADFRNAEVREDDFDPAAAAAAIKEPVTKLGNIWRLRQHADRGRADRPHLLHDGD